jgi:hypothetical protein
MLFIHNLKWEFILDMLISLSQKQNNCSDNRKTKWGK